MIYGNQILFFLGGIGVFNCLVVALYFLFSKSNSILTNRLFGFFLLVLNLRVLKSLFYAFSTEEPIWFLQFGPAFFLLIGPTFLNYSLSVIKPNSFWVSYWKFHVFSWVLVAALLMVIFPFSNYNELNKNVILPLINLQWFVYLLGSLFLLKRNYKNTIQFKWLLKLTLAVSITWFSYTFTSFDYFVSSPIIFSFLFYSFFVFFLFNKKKASKIFGKKLVKKVLESTDEDKRLLENLKAMMLNEKLFLNPDIKLSDVSKKIKIPSYELSKLINENLGISFTDYINEFRILQAKELLKNKSLYTIDAIGNQSGFNSKSAFYKAFKKITGTTPAKFKVEK